MRWEGSSARCDWDAAAEAFMPLRPRIVRYLVARVRDRHVAEDLAQETLLRGILHAQKLRDKNAAAAWLLRIAWHVALDHHRRLARRRDAALQFGSEPWPARVAEEEGEAGRAARDAKAAAIRALWRALGRLKMPERVLLIGHHFVGLSCRELAGRAGTSRDAIKQRLSRARRRLRRLMGEGATEFAATLARRGA